MGNSRYEGLAARQAQWNAFHDWESGRLPDYLSHEERLAWYGAAFRFTREFLKPPSAEDIEIKVQYIREVRQRLAHLK